MQTLSPNSSIDWLVPPTPLTGDDPLPAATPSPTAELDGQGHNVISVTGTEAAIRDLIGLLDERLTTDLVTPWATIILAIASVVVAIMSWRAAHRANTITEGHRADDRERGEARFRRGIAVSLREWASASLWRAHFGVFFEYDDEEGKRLAQLEQRLSGRLEHEGEADGIRLIKYIRGDLAQINKQTRAMDDKALAILRHPSRFTSNRVKFDPIINDWAADPKSIRKDLDKAEAERAATRREEAEAFRRRLDEIAAQAVARATPKADS